MDTMEVANKRIKKQLITIGICYVLTDGLFALLVGIGYLLLFVGYQGEYYYNPSLSIFMAICSFAWMFSPSVFFVWLSIELLRYAIVRAMNEAASNSK